MPVRAHSTKDRTLNQGIDKKRESIEKMDMTEKDMDEEEGTGTFSYEDSDGEDNDDPLQFKPASKPEVPALLLLLKFQGYQENSHSVPPDSSCMYAVPLHVAHHQQSGYCLR
jgi:hypothetical protein